MTMEYRNLGSSSLNVSAISFGAWAAGGWMWGGNDHNDAVDAIRAAYDLGVTSIDTAPAYGQGASEEIVGEAIKNIPRDKVQVLTKYGLRWDLKKGKFHFFSKDNAGNPIDIYKYAARESIIKECEDSLRRLRTDYIDLYQIHWPDPTTPVEETMATMQHLIKQGKVKQAGVCNYNAGQLAEAQKYIRLVSEQVPYSLVNRKIEKEIVPYCLKNDLSVIAYSPLERGLLTGKIKPEHDFAEGDHRPGLNSYKKENIVRTNLFLEQIKPLAQEKNVSLAQLVIRWTIGQPGVATVLAGARNPKQAIENAKAIDVELSTDEINFITQRSNELELVQS